MELSEFFEREVSGFMKPIELAGYTKLPFKNSDGSLEGQLRQFLFCAMQEASLERSDNLWYGTNMETSKFSIVLNAEIDNHQVLFEFKGDFDPRYDSVALNGLQVRIEDYTSYYPILKNNRLNEPHVVYKALLNKKPSQQLQVSAKQDVYRTRNAGKFTKGNNKRKGI